MEKEWIGGRINIALPYEKPNPNGGGSGSSASGGSGSSTPGGSCQKERGHCG